MNTRVLSYSLVLFALATSCSVSCAYETDQRRDCETWPTNARDLSEVLGRRAVEAASLAATTSERDEARLDRLVAQDASFDLGTGDVGRPVGKGVAGFRKLLNELQADRYRFDGWDYMSTKVAPCDAHEVTIEFSSLKLGRRADVNFRFVDGKIVEAKGWERSMSAGDFPVRRDDR